MHIVTSVNRSMKASDIQHRLFDGINSSLGQINDYYENSKKDLRNTLDWLNSSKHFLVKLDSWSQNVIKTDAFLHPQLNTTANNTIAAMQSSTVPVHAAIDAITEKAEDYLSKLTKDLSNSSGKLRAIAQDLFRAYEDFISEVPQPFRSCPTANGLENGFQTHCTYLKYFNAVDEIEQRFNKKMAKSRSIHRDLSEYESDIMKSLNKICQEKFPMLKGVEVTAPPSVIDQDFDRMCLELKEKIANFRTPNLLSPLLNQFQNVTTMMKARKNFTATKVHEVSIDKDQIVEVIDPSLAECWKVRMPNGTEGYIPSTILEVFKK